MPNRKKQIFSVLLLLIFIVATVWIVLTQIHPAELWAAIASSSPWFLLAACLCMVLYTLLEGLSLRTILNSIESPTTVGRGFVYASIDIFMSYITPFATGGQPIMLYYMSKDGHHLTRASLAALLHTAEWTFSIVFCSIIGFALRPELWVLNVRGVSATIYHFCLILGVIFCMFVVGSCLVCMFSAQTARAIASWAVRVLARLKLLKNPDAKLQKLVQAIEEYRGCADYIRAHFGVAMRAFCYSIVQRLSFFAATYFVYLAMGGREESLVTLFAIQALICLAGYAIPIPGTVGVTELITYGLMGLLFSARADMIAAMALTRFVNYYFHMMFTGVVTAGNHIAVMRRERRAAELNSAEK